MKRILVTGASGFIGDKLCSILNECDFEITSVCRSRCSDKMRSYSNVLLGKNIDQTTDWTKDLTDIEVIIHLAARVHQTQGNDSSGLALFRETNVEATRNLAKQAARCGVKRFIFLSSIKVNGERTDERPISIDQRPKPEDSYATSKMEAEAALREIEVDTGMQVVIIRPPLVYGPEVKGNLLVLMSLIMKGVPLPLGAIDNRRDLVSIFNLCDLIKVCVLHPAASGRTFLVSDNESLSTPDLVEYLAKGLGRNSRVFPCPIWALNFFAGLAGKKSEMRKLIGNFQIDTVNTQQMLGWTPPLSVAESFRKMFVEE